jgi:redox-sensitive bicupin YhaK (pirin superfamily)
VGEQSTALHEGQLAVLGPGDTVRLRGAGDGREPGRLLLLAGVPIGEPVAHYGPFVMNTEQEIQQAIRDYQTGRMGEITRTARLD